MLAVSTSKSIATVGTSLLIAATLLVAPMPAKAARPCPPDVDCSGAVNTDDLLVVIGSWGTSNPSGDINGDNTVNTDDLVLLVGGWGPCVFNFGPAYANTEAHQIGLEMVDSLTLPQRTYQRIDRDLGIIRAAYPSLVGQTHSEAWVANEMLIGLAQGADLTDFECAMTFYQRVDQTWLADFGGVDLYAVSFAGKVNTEALGSILTGINGVAYADPNGMIGGENRWTPTDLGGGTWSWSVDDGFWDCFDGCDCHRYYEFEVTAAGAVSLTFYDQWGQEWCTW